MSGILNSLSGMGGGVLNSLFEGGNPEKFMQFLQSPEAWGLAQGLMQSGQPSFDAPPTFLSGLQAGFKNVFDIKKEQAKNSGLQGKFGKALKDYNAILQAYGPEHEYTKLAKQNIETLAKGTPLVQIGVDPETGALVETTGSSQSSGAMGKGGVGQLIRNEATGEITYVTKAGSTTLGADQIRGVANVERQVFDKATRFPDRYRGKLEGGKALFNDIFFKLKDPNLSLEEKALIEKDLEDYLVFDFLIPEMAVSQLQSSSGKAADIPARRHQIKVIRRGAPAFSDDMLENLPPKIYNKARKRQEAILAEATQAARTFAAKGFPVKMGKISTGAPKVKVQSGQENNNENVKNDNEEDEEEVDFSQVIPNPEEQLQEEIQGKVFKTESEARRYLYSVGVRDEKLKEVVEKRKAQGKPHTLRELATELSKELAQKEWGKKK